MMKRIMMKSGFRSFCVMFGVLLGMTTAPADSKPIKATCTTAQVADLVRNIGGEHVEVTALMGEGVDPHLYKASQGDVAKLMQADMIFYNGLMLEGRMGDIFVKMARSGKPTLPVTEALAPEKLAEPPEFEGHYDPHIWMDPTLWADTVPLVVSELSKLRPEYKQAFEKNGDDYIRALYRLHEKNKTLIASIPKAQRVLVTAHDAFGYFGKAYDIEVKGLQGISTAGEFGLQDIQRLIDLIVDRGVKAVFVESSVPARSIQALVEGCKAKGHAVKIGGELFSDAMGKPGTREGTYIGMMEHNVNTIVGALK